LADFLYAVEGRFEEMESHSAKRSCSMRSKADASVQFSHLYYYSASGQHDHLLP
jgi:hypothetical protein